MPDTRRIWIIGEGKPAFMFDAVLRESHTSELVTTDNPVETGVPITDHAYMMPDRLEIEAGVSDVWLGMRDANALDAFAVEEAGETSDALAPIGRSNPDVDWLRGEGGGDDSTRSQRAYQLLRGLQRSAEPFDVQTGLLLYRNMVVKTLTADQDKDTSAVVYFRASLAEIIRVGTETVTFPPRKPGKTARQGAAKANKGEQQAKPATAAQAESAMFAGIGDKVKGGIDAILGAIIPGGP